MATGTPAEPIGEPTMTTTTAVETAVSTQMFPPQPRSSPLQTIMGPVTQARRMRVGEEAEEDEEEERIVLRCNYERRIGRGIGRW